MYRGPDDEGLAGSCFADQAPKLAADVNDDEAFVRRVDLPAAYDATSALAAPLPAKLGVVVFYDRLDDSRGVPIELRTGAVRRASDARRASAAAGEQPSSSSSDDDGDDRYVSAASPKRVARRLSEALRRVTPHERRKSSLTTVVRRTEVRPAAVLCLNPAADAEIIAPEDSPRARTKSTEAILSVDSDKVDLSVALRDLEESREEAEAEAARHDATSREPPPVAEVGDPDPPRRQTLATRLRDLKSPSPKRSTRVAPAAADDEAEAAEPASVALPARPFEPGDAAVAVGLARVAAYLLSWANAFPPPRGTRVSVETPRSPARIHPPPRNSHVAAAASPRHVLGRSTVHPRRRRREGGLASARRFVELDFSPSSTFRRKTPASPLPTAQARARRRGRRRRF